MKAQAHDELVDRIAEACWSHALGEPCELKVRDVEKLLRLHLAERELCDELFACFTGQRNGVDMAAAIRNYTIARMQ